MSKVYVVHEQLRTDNSGSLVPKYDLTPAEEYGELVYLLGSSLKPFKPEFAIAELNEKLHYTVDDYLLLIGNPVFIGLAVAIAARQADGIVNMLQWHGLRREYVPISANLFG